MALAHDLLVQSEHLARVMEVPAFASPAPTTAKDAAAALGDHAGVVTFSLVGLAKREKPDVEEMEDTALRKSENE